MHTAKSSQPAETMTIMHTITYCAVKSTGANCWMRLGQRLRAYMPRNPLPVGVKCGQAIYRGLWAHELRLLQQSNPSCDLPNNPPGQSVAGRIWLKSMGGKCMLNTELHQLCIALHARCLGKFLDCSCLASVDARRADGWSIW